MKAFLNPSALLCAAALAMVPHPARALEIEGLPAPAEQRPMRLLQPADQTLPNGLRVIVLERPGLPLLSARLLVKTGSEADPEKLAGLAKLTASLLTQGTTSRTAPQIASETEALGASLAAEAGWDAIELSLTSLSENAAPACAILADVVCHPQFAPGEISRQRRQALDDLRLSLEEPGPLARAVAARVILGASPYAHPATGTPASLPRIERADLRAFHKAHFQPANAVLILAGQLTAAEGVALAEKAFGTWTAPAAPEKPGKKGAKPASETARPAAPAKAAGAGLPAQGSAGPRIILVDLPEAGQAAVYAGSASITRGEPDFATGEVANALLGGGYSARLNQEIRVKRGLSYGASSRLTAGRGAGLFAAACQTKNESAGEVVRVMLDEIGRLGREAASDEYLASRKAVLAGNFARELATSSGYASRLSELALHGLPLGQLQERLGRLDAISAAQAQAFAAQHWAPGAVTVIVVGQAKAAAPSLRKLFPQAEVVSLRDLDLDRAGAIGARGKGK